MDAEQSGRLSDFAVYPPYAACFRLADLEDDAEQAGRATCDGLVQDHAHGVHVHALIDQRASARNARNFAEADRIRKELEAKGVLLEDGSGGTIWRRK